ncbi:hypothetical protein [Streptomyces sp. NPDC045251]|uniref:hypothetical protein n=1 Tax=unclassified Streptomyces TaxID=2593676 RepID=UPI0033D34947
MKTAIRAFHGHPQRLAVGRCPACGRATYLSRRDARRAAKGMFPGVHHQIVQCGDRWHMQRVRGESR